jgi:hypothetical protein
MKIYRGSEDIDPLFFTSALDAGQLIAKVILPPEEIALGTQWVRGWFGSTVSLDFLNLKIVPLPGNEPWSSSP